MAKKNLSAVSPAVPLVVTRRTTTFFFSHSPPREKKKDRKKIKVMSALIYAGNKSIIWPKKGSTAFIIVATKRLYRSLRQSTTLWVNPSVCACPFIRPFAPLSVRSLVRMFLRPLVPMSICCMHVPSVCSSVR